MYFVRGSSSGTYTFLSFWWPWTWSLNEAIWFFNLQKFSGGDRRRFLCRCWLMWTNAFTDEEIASMKKKKYCEILRILSNRNVFPFIIQVIYMPLSVIITTFKKENVRKPLQGFGVLVPSKEQQNGLKTLGNALFLAVFNYITHPFPNDLLITRCTGTLFSSMMFPDRAPKDLYLYTTFVGGSRNKELAKASTYEKRQCL